MTGTSTTMIAIYFERALNGIRLARTTKVDDLVRRIGRSSRRNRTAGIIAAVVVAEDQAKKLRRVLAKHWAGQYRGAGIYSISLEEVEQVVRHLSGKYSLTAYGLGDEISMPSKRAALSKFARGRGARAAAGDLDQALANELLAAGVITRHVKRSTGAIEYRGTERSRSIARMVATEMVPGRGRLPPASSSSAPIIGEVVVPDPYMTPELLRHRMDEAEAAGADPHDVLRKEGYQGAVVNLRDQLGGFAALHLDEFQRRGVAEFRRTGEEGQLGGAKALDYEVTRVDTSLINVVTEDGAMARAVHQSARDMLKAPRPGEDEQDLRPGLVRLAIAERMALHGHSLRTVATALGLGSGGAARDRVKALALDIATDLAKHFGYTPSRRATIRVDGDQPDRWYEDQRVEIEASTSKTGKNSRAA